MRKKTNLIRKKSLFCKSRSVFSIFNLYSKIKKQKTLILLIYKGNLKQLY